MDVKILAVSKSKGVLAPYWEFEFSYRAKTGEWLRHTLSIDVVYALASRPDTGPLFEMCRAIQGTPPDEFDWLVGRIFRSSCSFAQRPHGPTMPLSDIGSTADLGHRGSRTEPRDSSDQD